MKCDKQFFENTRYICIVNILLNERDPSSELQVAMRLTQLPRAPCKSIIAVAPVTPIVGTVAGTMRMFPVGVKARLT